MGGTRCSHHKEKERDEMGGSVPKEELPATYPPPIRPTFSSTVGLPEHSRIKQASSGVSLRWPEHHPVCSVSCGLSIRWAQHAFFRGNHAAFSPVRIGGETLDEPDTVHQDSISCTSAQQRKGKFLKESGYSLWKFVSQNKIAPPRVHSIRVSGP